MGNGASVTTSQLLLNFERAVLEKIRLIRKREGRLNLISRLESRLNGYSGNDYKDPFDECTVHVTKEGKAAVLDALSYLKMGQVPSDGDSSITSLESEFSTDPCPPLRASAEDHAFDIGTVGIASHTSSNGMAPAKRIQRYAWWCEACSEVIYYGNLEVDERKNLDYLAQHVIDELIVDDGVPDRGHRKALFDPRFHLGGVGLFNHPVYGHIVVINLASSLLDESDIPERFRDEEEAQRMKNIVKKRKAQLIQRQQSGPLELVETKEALEERMKSKNAVAGTQWGNMGYCCGCGEAIRGGRIVEIKIDKANGTCSPQDQDTGKVKFHASCFACGDCRKPLKGTPFREKDQSCMSAGNPFVCEPCWASKYAPKCSHCSKPLLDKWVSMQGSSSRYHVECFEEIESERLNGSDGDAQGNKSAAVASERPSFANAKKKMDKIATDYASLGL